MKQTLGNTLIASIVAVSLVAVPALALAQVTTSPGVATETETCYVTTIVSNAGTQTAGYTETLQAGPETALLSASYSGGTFSASALTEVVTPQWIDPTTDTSVTGASWISSHTSWPGGSGNTEGLPTNDQWRLFQETFVIPAGAVVSSATLIYAADNAASVYHNGNVTPVSSTGDTYGVAPVSGSSNYATTLTVPLTVTAGTNTLDFVVRNWSSSAETNPTGLLYKAVVQYCVPTTPPAADVVVHIAKFIDGVPATPTTALGASFPMSATWTAANVGSGTGTYALDTTNAYETATVAMTSGADYSTYEMTDGTTVGATCATTPFSLVGYSTGVSASAALAATPTNSAPTFTNLTSDVYVIVWNHDCSNSSGTIGGTVTGGTSGIGVLAVTSVIPTDTAGSADNTYENGMTYTFNITVPTDEQNVQMKFADWVNTAPASIIPAGGNMKISSLQADNGGVTVPITAANTYSVPALHMTGDLDLTTAGLQVQIVVQMKIPVGAVNGSYATTYGVQTLP